MATSQDFVNWVCGKALVPRFLQFLFLTENSFFHRVSSGSAHPTVYFPTVKAFHVALPPVPEQRRIVAKIEELFSDLDAGVAALERAQTRLGRYRASVLQAAVEGRLTEAWRRENPPEETGEELLERILVERRKRWEEEYRAKYEAKGKKPPSGWKSRYKEPDGPDTSELPELPEGWCWATGAQLFGWSSGKGLPKKRMRPGAVPVYGGNGVSGEHDVPLLTEPTMVIGRVGAQCGNVHITGGGAWITDNAIYASLTPRSCHLNYLALPFRAANLNARSGGSGQPFVNQRILNELIVPVPPLAEQREIADEYDRQSTEVDAAMAGVGRNHSQVMSLRQAILKRAFEGRLVPQDPSDEPASVLLERIQAERDGQPKKKRRSSSSTDQQSLSL